MKRRESKNGKIEITVEGRLVSTVAYEFVLPDSVPEREINILLSRIDNQSNGADDVEHLLEKEIFSLKAKKVDKLGPEVVAVGHKRKLSIRVG